MTISGALSEFSLPEIFQLLEQGNKTGRLTIQEFECNSSYKGQSFHIWLRQGYIVAAANRLNGQGLISTIQERGWLSARSVSRITQVCDLSQPTGLCLKSQGLLEAEQLKLLFAQQVLQQVCKLFELKDGRFYFDDKATLPNSEMTGLTALPKDVTLSGLRILRDWTMLKSKLPDSSSGLVHAVSGAPKSRLNQLECQIWEFVDGNVSIQEIAIHLQLPVEKIQQVAFRLIVVGIAEEVPLFAELPSERAFFDMEMLPTVERENLNQAPSQSYLKNLLGFLKGRS